MNGESKVSDLDNYCEEKHLMINHAKVVLNSPMFAMRISRLTDIHYQKIYSLKRNEDNIKNLSKENLIKLNRLYHTHAFFENIHKRKVKNNGRIK